MAKIEKTTLYLLFSLSIQFSAIETRLVISLAKLTTSSLQWLEKKVGAHARWWAIAIFQLRELNIRQIRRVFSMRVHDCAINDAINYAQKGCAMQMRGITFNFGRNLTRVDWWEASFHPTPPSLFLPLWGPSIKSYKRLSPEEIQSLSVIFSFSKLLRSRKPFKFMF